MKKVTIILGILRLPTDLTAAVLALLTSYYLRYSISQNIGNTLSEADYLTLSQFLEKTYWLIPLTIALFAILGLYRIKTNIGLFNQIGRIITTSLLLFMTVLTYYFLIRAFPFSRLVVIYIATLLTIYATIGRTGLTLLHKHLLRKNIGRQKILLLGNNKTAHNIALQLKKDYQYELVGYLADRPLTTKTSKWLGKYADLEKICNKYKVEEIVQSTTESEFSSASCINFCRYKLIEYYYIPATFNLLEHKFQFDNLRGIPWLKWQKTPLEGWGRVAKRIFDLTLTIPVLIILSPLFLLVAILIKIDSKGTIFYKYLDNGKISTRIGQKGEPFYCYKFRTMQSNTHNQRYDELATKNHREGPIVKIKNDPRITKIGKFLRRFDLDELPQLINVIKGDMSLVGPRPHLPEEVAKYDNHHLFVLTIKPGITGLAQVSGRSQLNFDDEVKLDSYYIEHWSLWLDFKIALKTIPAVLFHESN